MNRYSIRDHCFVICAYKESPFLESCILSLLNQSSKSNILIETSTPNKHIEKIANKYSLSMLINNGNSGCANDWNFAFENAPYELITIAHQDDIYYENYSKEIIKYVNMSRNPVMIYTDYDEIRNDTKVKSNINLIIKRILNSHMKKQSNWSKNKAKKRTLFLGNAISCPTVTMIKSKVGNKPFDNNYTCSCDYKTWVNLLNITGDFVYIPKHLMAHRIYKESHTTIYLQNNIRQKEDAEILSLFWPYPFNKMIYKLYSCSQKNNQL